MKSSTEERLTVSYLRDVRTTTELLARCGSLEAIHEELDRLVAEGNEVKIASGWSNGFRIFYWIPSTRDTKKERRREMQRGELSIHDVRDWRATDEA